MSSGTIPSRTETIEKRKEKTVFIEIDHFFFGVDRIDGMVAGISEYLSMGDTDEIWCYTGSLV
jgi:hypothetical protein